MARRAVGRGPYEARLDAGRLAPARGGWEEAKGAFELLVAERETAEALDGLGMARWWLGDVDEGLDLRSARSRHTAPGASARSRLGSWSGSPIST